MSKDFSRDFYNSNAWKKTRNAIIARDLGLCQICKKRPARIVHHIVELTPENINNPAISLGEDNLISVCMTCHAAIHDKKPATIEYDNQGNITDAFSNFLQDGSNNPYDFLPEL